MRVRHAVAAIVLGLMVPAGALAAAPAHGAIWLNDPAEDVAETAFATNLCGFPVTAEVAGRIGFVELDRGAAPGTFALNVYGVRVSYTNPATGKTILLRDVGPDRFYVQDGVAYVAVTGRSVTGTGIVGVVKIDLTTGEVVHSAGNAIGVIYDDLCDDLS